ncbi:MAG: MopE-related protein, partial [Myxococcota bacterium]
DGADEDCDGAVDDDPVDGALWYADADGDLHGDPDAAVVACERPGDARASATDCDDGDPAVNPGEDEVWYDGVDQDCDGADADDRDGDGFLFAEDCDDDDAARHPGVTEACDGVDQDCDGAVPSGEADADGDGARACDGDCDDGDPAAFPGALEDCDGVDDDCDGEADDACAVCDLTVPGDHATVQGALDAAADGDVVCVGPGTWPENLDFLGKDVTLVGVHGPGATILDGGGVAPVVTFAAGEGPDAVLTGFTLQNGVGYGGGGVTVDGASPTLVDLVVTGNHAWNFAAGGGISVVGGDPAIADVIVTDNAADTWYCFAYYGDGGGIALVDSHAVLEDVDVSRNFAGFYGAGLYVEGGAPVLANVRIADNEGTGSGGGLYVADATLDLTNVVIARNEAADYYGDPVGGGLRASGATLALANVVVADNTADADAGGLSLVDTDVTLVNVAIAGNSSAGLWVTGGAVTLGACAVHDEVDGADASACLAGDPLFLDAAYHLDAASPLVDAGDGAILDPDGSPSDVGAWGGPGADAFDLDGDGFPAWWLPGAYDAATSPGMDCDDDDAGVFPGSGC